MPASMKSPPVEMPCASITNVAPSKPAWVKLKTPRITKPRWLIDEYAISFFMLG